MSDHISSDKCNPSPDKTHHSTETEHEPLTRQVFNIIFKRRETAIRKKSFQRTADIARDVDGDVTFVICFHFTHNKSRPTSTRYDNVCHIYPYQALMLMLLHHRATHVIVVGSLGDIAEEIDVFKKYIIPLCSTSEMIWVEIDGDQNPQDKE